MNMPIRRVGRDFDGELNQKKEDRWVMKLFVRILMGYESNQLNSTGECFMNFIWYQQCYGVRKWIAGLLTTFYVVIGLLFLQSWMKVTMPS